MENQVALLIVRTGGDVLNNCLNASATSGGCHADRLVLVEGFTRVIASMVSDPTVMLKLSVENPTLFPATSDISPLGTSDTGMYIYRHVFGYFQYTL